MGAKKHAEKEKEIDRLEGHYPGFTHRCRGWVHSSADDTLWTANDDVGRAVMDSGLLYSRMFHEQEMS
jgi:hypothetical protein